MLCAALRWSPVRLLALIEVNWSAEQLSNWAATTQFGRRRCSERVSKPVEYCGRVQLDAGCVLQFQCAASYRRLHTWPRIRQPTQDTSATTGEQFEEFEDPLKVSWCVQVLWFFCVHGHLKCLWVCMVYVLCLSKERVRKILLFIINNYCRFSCILLSCSTFAAGPVCSTVTLMAFIKES